MNKTQPIEQWMTDAAKEWFGDDIEFATKLRRTIACHYHASRAAQEKTQEETPKESIWRPVSQKPTFSDRNPRGCVAYAYPQDMMEILPVRDHEYRTAALGWCRTADLLALAPLPKEKTRKEKDAEFIANLGDPSHPNWTAEDISKAIAYGRATAREANP